MMIEGSVSFKRREMETMNMISIKASSPSMDKNVVVKSVSFKNKVINNPIPRSDSLTENIPSPHVLDSSIPKHEAAVKLQKVYKSFRTRRKLADCAVLVEQRWWKLLDFAELKQSSISFFDIEKRETAVSRWSRARTRAAKVGKGLSKDDKAQKLALQHWLEAIDPRHRYGHNLHFYYATWRRCDSRQPFFYWLDIGDGREVNLVEKCPRSKLQQQCIKYLGPVSLIFHDRSLSFSQNQRLSLLTRNFWFVSQTGRKAYEVTVENGKLLYKQSGKLLDTSEGPKDAKWIFVLSTSKTLYVGQKKKGTFQHSSFLAGGATSAAGRLVAENGILKAVWPHSGHYRPTEQNFQEFMTFLEEHSVDITDVKKSPIDEDGESWSNNGGTIGLRRSNASAPNLTQNMTHNLEAKDSNNEELSNQGRTDSANNRNTASKSNLSRRFGAKLTNIEIPKRVNLFERSKSDYLSVGPIRGRFSTESPIAGYETAEESFESEEDEDYVIPKRIFSEADEEDDDEEIILKASILRRINSKKGMSSYQLGKQLSCKWTTGAGPRIGCVRDYPSELQFRALEQVNLSPRNANCSPQTPNTWWRETQAKTRSNLR